MSDPVSTARGARESLSRCMSALQGDPSVPPSVLAVVPQIAQAMSALHAIERSGGAQVQPNANAAIQSIRAALTALQGAGTGHPTVSTTVEGVAASLSLATALTRAPAPPPPPPAARAVADPFAAAPTGLNAPATSGAPAVEVALGAQSPTNFYKGLSGNDIVDHGGVFVATYKIPKVGTPVRLKVSLPGGYEFEAEGVVRWSRDDGGSDDAPPGFGAQFTQITAEARQLIYRYARNREPLFHDDL